MAVSICWLVGQQAYTQTTEQISTKRIRRMALGQEYTLLTVGVDADKRTDPGFTFLDGEFFNIFIHFSWNNKWILMKKIWRINK